MEIRIRPPEPEDYAAAEGIMLEVQQLHVALRPDIYRPAEPV